MFGRYKKRVTALEKRIDALESSNFIQVYREENHDGFFGNRYISYSHYYCRPSVKVPLKDIIKKLMKEADLKLKYIPGTSREEVPSSFKFTRDK